MLIDIVQGTVQVQRDSFKQVLKPLFVACKTEQEVVNMAWDMLIFIRELSDERQKQIKGEI